MCGRRPRASANAPIAAEPPHELTQAAFAARLDRLGPFEPHPRLAVAVSGGADSTALALLAADWAEARGGKILALIVDHGLRQDAAAEAAATRSCLAALGIAADVLTLRGLHDATRPDAPIAVVARNARFGALTGAARAAGIVHLLLGHHAGDQAETRLMRARAGSGPAGLAGMAAVRETEHVRLLRPLLDIDQPSLTALLQARGVGWNEDPSNRDLRTLRAQARAELAAQGAPPAGQGWNAAARMHADAAAAAELAARVMLSPLGYAVISPGPIGAAALAALWQAISGRRYPPPQPAIAALAAAPRPATLAGARLLAAGRLGPGWLLVRDAPPPPPVPAVHDHIWDRFRLHSPDLPPGYRMGAYGDARGARTGPPAVVRRLLPALFRDGRLAAVPHLGVGAALGSFRFAPALPAAGAPFSLPFRDA